jgi:hypothetical protein
MEMAGLKDVRNRLRITSYSGTAQNLRDPSFREKVENFGRIGLLGELI